MTASERSSSDSFVGRPTAAQARAARDASISDVHAVRRSAPRLSSPELHAGDVLEDRYILLSQLGEGGMGDVWLAHNPTLDMDVALKVLRVDESRPDLRSQMTHRLLMEARATAKLGHPAIVRIIDFGETPAGSGFYVMELLDGEDLCTLLERHGRLSPVKAVRTLLPIASALAAAHAKQIVHRDIKPDNIFLARDAEQQSVQPKLIDFGIAKLSNLSERVTAAGAIMGSPGYMSPEQMRGEDADERADVWGLSIVLYETITGRLPFEGKNFFALMRAIIEDEPAPSDACDAALWAIIRRGLEKAPGQRWQSMRDLGAALAAWLVQNGISEDICGTQLSTVWLRPDSLSDATLAPDPFVSASVPALAIDAARRERSDSVTGSRGSAPPALRRRSFMRSRNLAALGLVLGVGGVIASGAWAQKPRAEAAPAKSFAALVSEAADVEVKPDASASQPVATLAPTSPPVLESSSPSATAPAPSAAIAPAERTSARQKASAPKAKTSALQPAQAQDAAPPASMLKNPF